MIDNQKRLLDTFKREYTGDIGLLFLSLVGLGITLPLSVLIIKLAPGDRNALIILAQVLLSLGVGCVVTYELAIIFDKAKSILFLKELMDKVKNNDYVVHEVYLADEPKHIKNGICYLTVIDDGKEIQMSCAEDTFNKVTKDTLIHCCTIIIKTKKDKTREYNVYLPQIDTAEEV